MKFYPRVFLLFLLFSLFATTLSAQTISITNNFDTGPYSPGSTIAVPFHIDDAGGCIDQTNTFRLFLSNANGTYPATPLATVTGFYATYINAVIPSGTPAGSGYRIKIISTANPAAIAETPTFSISGGMAVTASITSASEIDNGTHPDVFGNCNSSLSNFTFTDNSMNAASVGISFINESTQNNESTVSLSTGGSGAFNPAKTNYTIIVKATNGSVIGTRAYTLINNPFNSNFGFSGTQSVCLGSTLTFNIDIISPDGIQFNYPGNTYKFDWGDGSSTVLTFCQIRALAGHVGHQYLSSSCGSIVGAAKNVFKISFEPNNPYCGSFNAVSTTAKVSAPPLNVISGSANACTGVPVTFNNNSYPGEDPSSNAGNCVDFAGARYTWKVDGVIAPGFSGVPKSKVFNPSLSAGTHTITLQLDNNPTSCGVADAAFQVCVQDKPQSTFDITTPTPVCLINNSATVSVANTTVTDNACFTNPFSWKVTRGSGSSITTVSTSNLANPTFTFTIPDIYTISLTVTDACGADHVLSKNVVVSGPPEISFTNVAPSDFCGPQTIAFDNTINSPTRIVYTGTPAGVTANYSWTISSSDGTATFVNPTNNASQYPKINFPAPGTYIVAVTYTNDCGIQSTNKIINIRQAPTVSAGTDATICASTPTYTLSGTIDDMSSVTGISWTKSVNGVIDNAATFNNGNTLSPTYTFKPADIGKTITFTLNLQTTLPQECSIITRSVNIMVSPFTVVTSASSQSICSGTALSYAVTASDAGSTFTWTASGTPNASGYSSQSTPVTSPTITDLLTTNNSSQATVTYTITPVSTSGCSGTPFTYTVTVNPLPVTDPLTNVNLCSGEAVNSVLQLTANLPGTKYTWTATASSVNVTGFTDDATPATAINQVLVNSGTSPETVTYTITPVSASGCTGATTASVTITVLPLPTAAIADPSPTLTQELCDQATFQLNGNTPVIGNGKWTQPAGQTAVLADDTDPHTTVSGLTANGNTYHFTWTITSGCGSSAPSTVTVIDYPASAGGTTTAITPVCTGAEGDVTLSGYTGQVQSWQTSGDGGNNWTTVSTTADVFHYTNLTVTTMFRAIVQSGNCSTALSSAAIITVTPPISNNSITNTGANEICNGATPGNMSGSTPQGGDGSNYTYQWQQSTDGTNYTDINNATAADYQSPALTVTTYFRRLASSGFCAGNTSSISNAVMIKVDAAIHAVFAAAVTSTCSPFNLNQNINGVNNISVTTDPNIATYTWYADAGSGNQQIGTGAAFPGYTLPNDGQNVTITLTVNNALGCQDSKSITFSTIQQVTAGFSTSLGADFGCADPVSGNLTVSFTNTSAPAGGNFIWSFGDGTPNYEGTTPPAHDFAAATDGTDKVYTITLTPVGCSSIPSTRQITVYPAKPVAIIDPGTISGCAPYAINVINKSPGTNNGYVYTLLDENNNVIQTISRTDKSGVQFDPINTTTTKTYTLYMEAANRCGTTNRSNSYPITIQPSAITAHMSVSPLNASGNITGCAPFQTILHNLSTGGATYQYHIYDNNSTLIANIDISNTGTGDSNYIFTNPGTYYVSVSVSSNCTTGVESDKIPVTVLTLPAPGFNADATTSCSSLTVNFTNSTPDSPNEPAASYAYLWDFGDGTTSNQYTPPAHTYQYRPLPYTVTLTATNANGCQATAVKTDYIIISPPPGTDFAVLPGTTINIPNYHFSFLDESAVMPVSWHWDFGDRTSSTEQNPGHTYADTGKYVVTLTTVTANGCTDSRTREVRITGVPGQLYVPNAFMPGSISNELRVFTVKGSGIKNWDMRIYDNWGQLIFETTKLSTQGEPIEFWDGRYKGQEVPQGGYLWQISATFLNGTDWKGMAYKEGAAPKKSGLINLIR